MKMFTMGSMFWVDRKNKLGGGTRAAPFERQRFERMPFRYVHSISNGRLTLNYIAAIELTAADR